MLSNMGWIIIFVFVTVNLKLVNLIEVPQNITSYPCTDQNHIFLVPGVLTAGGSSRACVSRFHYAGPVRMVVTLRAEGQPAVTAVREMTEGDGGCIDILVPLLPNTKAEMAVNLRYPEAHCAWERRIEMRIGGSRVVVAHTERARYRPGELVRVRVFVLKTDLTPAHGAIEEIWLEGPRGGGAWEGARAEEWRRVRTRLGVAQLQHQLDAQAPHGRWTLRVKLADGSQGAAAFHVGDYELPPFQLSVRHSPKVLSTSDRLVWTVCVRYPWTEAVEGMLVIRIRGAGGGSTNGIHTAVRLRAPRACHRHAAAARRIGLDGTNPPDVVVADFSFQEESTRIWQNTTVVSQIVDKAVTLEFLTKHRAVISPWLPHKLKVKATRWDNKPAANEHVKVCRTPAPSPELIQQNVEDPLIHEGVCKEAITDAEGVARVLFLAEDDGSSYCRFRATLKNDSSISAAPLYLPVQRQGTVHAVLGPLKSDGQGVRTFVPLYLSLKRVTNALTVHFVVITRGGIIYRWGATTQCPISKPNDPIQTASRDSRCYMDNLLDTNEFRNTNESIAVNQDPVIFNLDSNAFDSEPNVSDALSDKQLLRVMLPVKVSHQMCPDSHLIAYFYYKGELVTTSKHFEMEECFDNKVEATFLSRQASPGTTTSLHLRTSGAALCALSALDVASKWIQPAPSVKEVLLAGLTRLVQGHRNLTEYDAAGDCFLKSDNPTVPTTSLELAIFWLAGAGVRLVGGDRRSVSCFTAPAPLLADYVTVPRSDFSEAWLWRLVLVGANGSATVEAKAPDSITRYEASAVCVAKTGVDISQPAVLQVFREFFIHADGPRRLRRGDTCIISYRIFNYLYEPLSVQIQVLTDPHFEGPKDFIETACISARSSIARRVGVTATLPGNARVSVRAIAVLDGNCANATRSGVSDEVIVQVTVDPEGVLMKEQKSILLCGAGSKESSTSEVSWSWPEVQAVPGTEALMLWAVGDVAGPLFADADDLVTLPRGCGEQNLARMATSLLALRQLDPASETYAIAKEHVARGFTRQLQYVHPLGGFSAFGAGDASPSTWLTAFAMRYMKKALQVLHPGTPPPPALSRAESWLLAQQMENGCFRNEGQVFHRELRGGLNEDGEAASVALTAYVITSLMESSILPAGIIRNALSCLRALPTLKNKSPTRIYAHSLIAYAFMRLRRYEDELQKMNEASVWEAGVPRGGGPLGGSLGGMGGAYRGAGGAGLREDEEVRQLADLLDLATRGEDFVWWDTGSLATSIEATGYALLALSAVPADLQEPGFAHDPRAAIRWLSTHRNPMGGFVATQDTLVALEALTTWSSSQPQTPTRLKVTARSGALTRTATLMPGVKVPIHVKMGTGYALTVGVEGTGCSLIQATRYYNVLSMEHKDSKENGTGRKQLSVQVTVHTDGVFNCEANQTNCYCAAVVETCVLWADSFPEMALLEVSLPGGYGADASLLYSQLSQGNTLLRRIELSPSRITYYLGSGGGGGSVEAAGRGGHECWRAHAVGPRVRTQPAHVIVKSYYAPEINDTQMYTISEECPPRITHEVSQYLPSENLFIKSRSAFLNNGTPIFNNYTYQDIPDGIPLEDPLYDNFIRGKFDTTLVQEKEDNKIEGKDSLNSEEVVESVNVKQSSECNIIESKEEINHYEKDMKNFDKVLEITDVKPSPETIINESKEGKIKNGEDSLNKDKVLEVADVRHDSKNIINEDKEKIIQNGDDSSNLDKKMEIKGSGHSSENIINKNNNKIIENGEDSSNLSRVMDQKEKLVTILEQVIEITTVKDIISDRNYENLFLNNSHEVRGKSNPVNNTTNTDLNFNHHYNETNETLTSPHFTVTENIIIEASKKYTRFDDRIKSKEKDFTNRKLNTKENSFPMRKDIMLNTDYNKMNSADDEIDRIVGIDMNSGNSPLKLPKRSRRVKFFTDEEVIPGNEQNFDPKPLEVQLNSESISGENKVHKTDEIEVQEKENVSVANQNTKLLKTIDQEDKIREHVMNAGEAVTVDNPSLSEFHIIESEHDLDVPSGIEGPIPVIALPPPGMSRNYATKPYFDTFQSKQQSHQQPNDQSQPSPNEIYPRDQHYQSDQTYDQSYHQPIPADLIIPPPEMSRNYVTKPHFDQNFQPNQQSNQRLNFQSQSPISNRYPPDQHHQNDQPIPVIVLPPPELSRNYDKKPYFDQNFQSDQQSNFQSQSPNKLHSRDQHYQNDQHYPKTVPDIPPLDKPRNNDEKQYFDQNLPQSSQKLPQPQSSPNNHYQSDRYPHDQHFRDGQPYQIEDQQVPSYQQHMFGGDPYQIYHPLSPHFNPNHMALEYGQEILNVNQ